MNHLVVMFGCKQNNACAPKDVKLQLHANTKYPNNENSMSKQISSLLSCKKKKKKSNIQLSVVLLLLSLIIKNTAEVTAVTV